HALTREIYTLSLHDALPICEPLAVRPAVADPHPARRHALLPKTGFCQHAHRARVVELHARLEAVQSERLERIPQGELDRLGRVADRKSTRLNSSHSQISYAV